MFDIITKEDYWDWLAAEVLPISASGRPGTHRSIWKRNLLRLSKRLESLFRPGHLYTLKDVQDAFIMSCLGGQKEKRILEVGGGMPRVLRWLSARNECWLVDRYEGVGRGPKEIPSIPGIKILQGFIGEFIEELPEEHFDYLFSVSVVEHVPLESLENFFADCARLLKPSGRMYHAIDIYLFDDEREDLRQPFREKLIAYLRFANRPDLGIRLIEEAQIDAHLRYSCAYATQPDNVLYEWHLNRPQEKRLMGQVVSIKSAWEKYS